MSLTPLGLIKAACLEGNPANISSALADGFEINSLFKEDFFDHAKGDLPDGVMEGTALALSAGNGAVSCVQTLLSNGKKQ